MATLNKSEVIAEIKERLTASEGVLLVDYRGLTVKDISELRSNLREVGGAMTVYKNTLTELALRELAMPTMEEHLEGPTAFVFIEGDPVAPAKALTKFAEGHAQLELKAGLLGNTVLDKESVIALSKLPSREELLAKLLGTLQNPTRGFVTVCAGPARGLVTALDAIAKQKDAA